MPPLGMYLYKVITVADLHAVEESSAVLGRGPRSPRGLLVSEFVTDPPKEPEDPPASE